jgi:hypothetical protein
MLPSQVPDWVEGPLNRSAYPYGNPQPVFKLPHGESDLSLATSSERVEAPSAQVLGMFSGNFHVEFNTFYPMSSSDRGMSFKLADTGICAGVPAAQEPEVRQPEQQEQEQQQLEQQKQEDSESGCTPLNYYYSDAWDMDIL